MKERTKNIITVVCILCIALSVCAFILIYYNNKHEEFVYNNHLAEKVLTVKGGDEGDSVDISLKEMTYYIINVEGDINDMALQYNSKHPDKYWLVKIDSGRYMKDYAKELAFDSCVRDNIYYLEALKHNVTLTDEELQLASEDARTIMKNITSKQMDASEFSIDVLYKLEQKLYLASKYANELVEQGYTMEELELRGAYFEELRQTYETDVNDELWDKVRLGNITIENKVSE